MRPSHGAWNTVGLLGLGLDPPEPADPTHVMDAVHGGRKKGYRPPPPPFSRRSALGELEHRVLLAGVGVVLERDDAQLGELRAEPAAVGVEQAELLAVGHDLREQQLLEHLLLRRVHHERHGLHRHAHAVPDLLLQEPVAHPHGRLERELLALGSSASVSSS